VDVARKPRTRGAKLAPVLVGGVGLIAVVASLFRSQAAAAPVVERASVWTSKVERGDLVRDVPVQGTLVPEHVQWLSAVSAARVAHIAVRPGAVVDADTVVVELENADLELARLEAEHQAANAEAALIQLDVSTSVAEKQQESALSALRSELRDAQRHASAAEQLAPQGLMSELDHNDALNRAHGLEERVATETSRAAVIESGRGRQLAAQRAEIARLREIAQFRRRQIAALQVRAGVHGVVQEIPLENGQWVAIGTLLAKVAEPDHLKAEVKVAEGNARELHRGLPVRFEAPSGPFRGHVDRVDPTVIGGSVKLTVTLDDALPPGARADQTVTGFVEIDTLREVLFVSRPAGARDGETVPLFRLEPDGATARRTRVALGRGSGRQVEVQHGLAAGDTVVVSDTSTWETTDRIRLR
jgi:multidrug efflux pump subunit AcrA (membrane-fusion protein)